MRYEFWAREVDPIPGQPDSSTDWEPKVPVDVIGPSGPDHARRFHGLADTGAAFTIFPGHAMKPLGIVDSVPYRFGSASALFTVRLALVDLTLVSPAGKPFGNHR